MAKRAEALYFDWLLDLLMYDEMRKAGRNYTKLIECLDDIIFEWDLPMDRNRAEDGVYLRYMFYTDTGIDYNSNRDCSFLEMLIGLSIRINDDMFGVNKSAKPGRWFWMMMENCGLDEYTDENFDDWYVRDICYKILGRKFTSTGQGGLFPMKHPKEDQRNVDFWYQMQAYIMENFEK